MFEFHDAGKLVDGELELVLIEKYPGNPDIAHVPAYKYVMTIGGTEAGRIALRVGDLPRLRLYFGHIGYSVHPEFRGHRYAARSCKLLLPLARSHGMPEIWITCDPTNTASRKTCELAGGTLIEIIDLPEDTIMYQEGSRQACRYRIEL